MPSRQVLGEAESRAAARPRASAPDRAPRSRRRGPRRNRQPAGGHFSLAFHSRVANMSKDIFLRRSHSTQRRREETMGWKPVTKAATTSGSAEGTTPLNAFDNALLAAGIGNINLVKVSSILPPEAAIVDLPRLRPGAIVPTAYAAMTSEVPGEVVAAAVGWARPADPKANGVIMEFHDKATPGRSRAGHRPHARRVLQGPRLDDPRHEGLRRRASRRAHRLRPGGRGAALRRRRRLAGRRRAGLGPRQPAASDPVKPADPRFIACRAPYPGRPHRPLRHSLRRHGQSPYGRRPRPPRLQGRLGLDRDLLACARAGPGRPRTWPIWATASWAAAARGSSWPGPARRSARSGGPAC